jgi:transposase
MRFIGLDVHRTFAEVAILEDGRVRLAGQIATTAEALQAFAQTLTHEDQVVLEATSTLRASPDYCRRTRGG